MELAEMVADAVASNKEGESYVEEVRSLLPALQQFMECILEELGTESGDVAEYLLGMVQDTVSAVENKDETLLRDVLEHAWGSLIIDVMGEKDSGLVQKE